MQKPAASRLLRGGLRPSRFRRPFLRTPFQPSTDSLLTLGVGRGVGSPNANPSDFRTMVNGFANSQEYRGRFVNPNP